jgi:hypothetical protein
LNNINNLLNNEIKIGIIYVHTLDSKKIQIPDYENNTIYIMDKFIDVDSFTKSAEPGIYHTKPDTNNHFSDLGNQIMYQSIFSYFKNRN